MSVVLTALSRSGRLSVTVATPSATSYSSVSYATLEPDRPYIFAGGRGLGRSRRDRRQLLQLGHDVLGEQAHVALGLVVRHARVGEDADVMAVAGAPVDVEDAL